jgi:tungstate transport system ATP-binding protein
MAFLEIRDLGKSYGQAQILKDINLGVEKGEILGLIGPTGSGKSTLLRLIDLLEEPSRGTIILEGRAVSGRPEKERIAARRRMAMVFQKPVMFKSNVLENVTFGLMVRGEGQAEQRKEKARAALQAVGLSGYESRDANTLSGGEMQRVAICRALINDPDLILADEPTGNLDSASGRQVLEILRRLRDEQGKTILLVTHSPEGAAMADRVLKMSDGKLLGI